MKAQTGIRAGYPSFLNRWQDLQPDSGNPWF